MQGWLILIAGGMVIGVLVAAPIGPVNLICIRRTLAYGTLNGFVSGLGAALGDGVFAAITAYGLTAIAQMIEGYSGGLQLAGGFILVGFGLQTFFAPPKVANPRINNGEIERVRRTSLLTAMASTFALTITNPATLIGFAALFAGLGSVAGADGSLMTAGVLVGSVILGSTGWWLVLCTFTGLFHGQLTQARMRIINQGSGLFIGAFGLIVLGHLILDRWLHVKL